MTTLKQFFVSMLGSLAALWLTVMLLFLLVLVAAVGTIASAFSSGKSAVKVSDNTILQLTLDSTIDEREAYPDFMEMLQGSEVPVSLETLLRAINAAADDDKIAGLVIECDGATAGLATRYELVEAIKNFRQSGKWVVAYGDNFSQGDYYVASQADEIFLNPEGELALTGLSSQIMFFTGLMEKLGVEMQVTKVGTYKSAVEPFLLKKISEPNREQMDLFLGSLWGEITSTISDARNVPATLVNLMADSLYVFSQADVFVENNLIDGTKYQPEFTEYLMEKVGVDDFDDLNIVSCEEYAEICEAPHSKSNKNKIAVIYAFGEINADDEGGITAGELVPTIMDVTDDKDIEAVVLRVNSPGGSAFAAEQIWHALNLLKDSGKKLYVSMGDYAASGGYYISCNADKIYAAPTTLTGSIGVFGMIPCAKGLINGHLGLNVDYVSTNPTGMLPNLFEPMTPFQRRKLQNSVDRIYETFTSHVAEGRHMPVDSVKKIAEGRVWDGMTALKIGLVDEIGTLEKTIADLAEAMGYDNYQVVAYPEIEPNFWSIFSSMKDNIRTSILRSELGENYPIYNEIKRLKNLDPVQCRMETMVVE